MTDRGKHTKERRKVLLSIVAGGGVVFAALPEQWVKPVVDTITLLAHAAVSCPKEATDCDSTGV